MHNDDTIMRCRVCGLLSSDPPWGYDGVSPTFDFCPCCGVEFGYEDAYLWGHSVGVRNGSQRAQEWMNPEE